MEQLPLFTEHHGRLHVQPFRTQLLKWVGNKQRFAHLILAQFPARHGTYYEPFLGSGAVLGTLAPAVAVASDALRPLMSIWDMLVSDPEALLEAYTKRWEQYVAQPEEAYLRIRDSFNHEPNGCDLVFLA